MVAEFLRNAAVSYATKTGNATDSPVSTSSSDDKDMSVADCHIVGASHPSLKR
jgi:hypothetical protein